MPALHVYVYQSLVGPPSIDQQQLTSAAAGHSVVRERVACEVQGEAASSSRTAAAKGPVFVHRRKDWQRGVHTRAAEARVQLWSLSTREKRRATLPWRVRLGLDSIAVCGMLLCWLCFAIQQMYVMCTNTHH